MRCDTVIPTCQQPERTPPLKKKKIQAEQWDVGRVSHHPLRSASSQTAAKLNQEVKEGRTSWKRANCLFLKSCSECNHCSTNGDGSCIQPLNRGHAVTFPVQDFGKPFNGVAESAFHLHVKRQLCFHTSLSDAVTHLNTQTNVILQRICDFVLVILQLEKFWLHEKLESERFWIHGRKLQDF